MTGNKTMRVALCVVALACCAVVIQAASTHNTNTRTGRHLLYTCSDAKALSGNCDALCKCVQDKGQSVADCSGLCQKCVAATANCPKDNSLPKDCADYAGNSAVSACISGGSSGRRLY